jgi:Transcriptional regulator/sugar kinase
MMRPQGCVVLGLRLARRAAAAVLVDAAGVVIAEQRAVAPEELIAAGKALLTRKPAGAEMLGIGAALSPDDGIGIEDVRSAFAPMRVLANADSATAATAERLIGAGDRNGGFVSILVTRSGVRAGLSIGGRPFHGIHGFAGGIGAMRTGHDRGPLADSLSPDRLDAAIAAGGIAMRPLPSGRARRRTICSTRWWRFPACWHPASSSLAAICRMKPSTRSSPRFGRRRSLLAAGRPPPHGCRRCAARSCRPPG